MHVHLRDALIFAMLQQSKQFNLQAARRHIATASGPHGHAVLFPVARLQGEARATKVTRRTSALCPPETSVGTMQPGRSVVETHPTER